MSCTHASRRPGARRGMTLVEMMVAHTLALVVLAAGVTAAVQLQRRSHIEEQRMAAQAGSEAARQILEADLRRAGTGMGNALIRFSDAGKPTTGHALEVLTDFDLRLANPLFPEDPDFRPPSGPYANLVSDVLQLWWGDPNRMLLLVSCGGGDNSVRDALGDFCTIPLPPNPFATAPDVFVVNPGLGVACHASVQNVRNADARVELTMGRAGQLTLAGPCASATDPMWSTAGWMLTGAEGVAYRVNWASGGPVAEVRQPAEAGWTVVSRSVEQFQVVRQAVANLSDPALTRWFPDAALPSIDQCTLTGPTACTVPDLRTWELPLANDTELRNALQRRVREVEVRLVVRSPRTDLNAARADLAPDEAGFPQDGFKRRVLTFRPSVRNLSLAGVLR